MKGSDIKVGEAYYHARGAEWRGGRGFQVGKFVPTTEPVGQHVTGTLTLLNDPGAGGIATVNVSALRGPFDGVAEQEAVRIAKRQLEADAQRHTDAVREAEDDRRAERLDMLDVPYLRDRAVGRAGAVHPTREGLDRLLDLAERKP